jgi:pyridoxine 5-phosphate synthase
LYTEALHINGLGIIKELIPTQAAILANELGLGINAGHDLSLDNIQFSNKIFRIYLKFHWSRLISEALYLGLDNVVNMYLQKLK